jgi:OOP family OmpA-OmpF porin
VNPARVVASWLPYQALDPQSVLKRLKATLDPPPSVTLEIASQPHRGARFGAAAWLERARAVARIAAGRVNQLRLRWGEQRR